MQEFVKARSEATHRAMIRGSSLEYRAICENFPVFNTQGEALASISTFTYERTDIEGAETRPVLFFWNGGPGCSSVYLHMGLLGPTKIKFGNGTDFSVTAPVECIENENCPLDLCDIVAVDPAETGFSRFLSDESRSLLYTTDGDADSMVSVIRQWLTAHRRWNSPIYLLGESYGTIRAAQVAERINTGGAFSAGLHISGVILLGPAIGFGEKPLPIYDAVLNLPSNAAAQWYWHPEGKGSLEDFVQACDNFCYSEYLPALALGGKLPEAQKQAVAEKLHRFTGLPVEKLLADKLVVDTYDFSAHRFADEGKSVGLYDARLSAPAGELSRYDFSMDAGNQIYAAFIIALNSVLRERFGIESTEEYRHADAAADPAWNWKPTVETPKALENAMQRNQSMKLMFGVGHYDMLCTGGLARYICNHYNLPAGRTEIQYYESGHMPYLGDDLAKQVLEDVRALILR